ncbi:calcium-binding protein, partial [Nostoc sp. 'Peltigera malacea cyanobiont' DB3992]|uniref:calcium-binding protein n=1 Tax=Nostoc sp. 'Peltigera malacea cyanobiont' DB3992 TaxID=1206980 RepID=UPI000C060F03
NDSLFASYSNYEDISGNNTLKGGAGDDYLSINGRTGNFLNGDDGNDTLSTSGTSDTSNGSDYGNTLNGGTGDDSLRVDYSKGSNQLSGGDGNDTLSAYSALGNNTFYGGNGNDILTSGFGNDTFVFYNYNEGVDTIYDFNATNELIQISAAGFGGGLSIGSLLKTSQFTIGTSATTSNQRFIYNSATGGLFFDLDGSASGFTQVQFAQLSTGLSLSENNFVVVYGIFA